MNEQHIRSVAGQLAINNLIYLNIFIIPGAVPQATIISFKKDIGLSAY
jgi:hypothetical protein